MSDSIITFLVNAGAIIVIGGIVVYSIWWRRNQLKKFAESQSLQYDIPVDKQRVQALLDTRQDLPLFQSDRAEIRCQHALSANIGDAFFVISELKYRISSKTRNQGRRNEYFTIAMIISESMDLPSMHMEPEGWGWRITTKLLGFQDIDFEEHKAYSKKYVLQGPDEDAIRNFLDKEKLDALTALPAFYIDTSKDILLLYLKKEGHKPKRLKELAENANKMFKIFTASS